MGKTDDKGEPVKTVTIGGKKVEVPIIFVLPEEAGEKEIERYERPKVHIDSKKIAPVAVAAAPAAGGAAVVGGTAARGVASAGSKAKPSSSTVGSVADVAGNLGGGSEGSSSPTEPVESTVGLASDTAKLSETLAAESKEESLDKLTDGKLEEVEKLPFPVPREETRDEKIEATRMNEDRAVAEGKVRPPQDIHLINTKDPFMSKAEDNNVDESIDEMSDSNILTDANEDDEEDTPYFDLLSDKPKRKKKPVKVSYRALFDKGYGKAQALRRSVEEQKKRGAKTDDELAAEKEKEIPKGQQGFLNYNYLHNQPDIEDKKDYLTDEEGDEIEKSWEKWLQNKSLGALGWGKLNRDGTKKKLRRRQPTLDDYPDDDNGDKKDET